MEGILLKQYGGFYFVYAQGESYTCRIRGSLKRNGTIYPGDYVKIQRIGAQDGVIEEILPRKNEMIRPKMANIDQCLIVLAVSDPEPDMLLLDKILLWNEKNDIRPIICFNKCDLAPQKGQMLLEIYQKAGYCAFCNSNINSDMAGWGFLSKELSGKATVLAGPSGVGKSSLINAMFPDVHLETGQISDKLGRGKHTTRFAQLLALGEENTFLADTPGFSLLELPHMTEEELQAGFGEIAPLAQHCRFQPCLHDKEPGCAVKEAVAAGQIDGERYKRYLYLLEQIRQQKERWEND